MNFKRISVFTLIFCMLLSVSAFARKPVTTLSGDDTALSDNPILMLSPITVGKGNLIGGFLGKALNIPKQIKVKNAGFLSFAMAADAIQVEMADKSSFHQKSVLPYFLNSKEVRDSLKLRKTARQIRYQAARKALANERRLTKEQKTSILGYLSSSVGAPLVVLAKSPLPSFTPEPGPCMIPLGVEIVDKSTGKRAGLETSMICVLDIKSGSKTIFSVDNAMRNDTLDLVLCHENGHGIMFDMYGKLFSKIQRTSTNGHDAPIITDVGMAYTEGWAEAFEAVYGPSNPKLKEKDRKKYNISEFLYSRQSPIRRDRYIWAKLSGKKTGVLKNGLQIMSTEGAVAGLFYDILTSRAIIAPFDKCVTTMLENPLDFVAFVKTFVKLFPKDKKVVYRILLEGTHYVTLDNKAAIGYRNFYQHKLAFVQKKTSKENFLKARNAYKKYTEALYKRAMAGADVFANVGPQMWFSGKIELSKGGKGLLSPLKKKFGKKKFWSFRMDLNTVTEKMLRGIRFTEVDAQKIIAARDAKAFFTGNPVATIKKVLGDKEFSKYNVLHLDKFEHRSEDMIANYAKQSAVLWPEDLEKIGATN